MRGARTSAQMLSLAPSLYVSSLAAALLLAVVENARHDVLQPWEGKTKELVRLPMRWQVVESPLVFLQVVGIV